MRKAKVILLDYQATLVSNFHERNQWRANNPRSPYTEWIKLETYRDWLVNLIKDQYVILITARDYKYRIPTLERIKNYFAGTWEPNETYWNTQNLRPDKCKDEVLRSEIFPRHGTPDKTDYLALESNQLTRAMYARRGITAIRIDSPISELPQILS